MIYSNHDRSAATDVKVPTVTVVSRWSFTVWLPKGEVGNNRHGDVLVTSRLTVNSSGREFDSPDPYLKRKSSVKYYFGNHRVSLEVGFSLPSSPTALPVLKKQKTKTKKSHDQPVTKMRYMQGSISVNSNPQQRLRASLESDRSQLSLIHRSSHRCGLDSDSRALNTFSKRCQSNVSSAKRSIGELTTSSHGRLLRHCYHPC